MDAVAEKALLKEVFGESSDSEDDEEQKLEQPEIKDWTCEDVSQSTSEHRHSWEQIKEIKGLWLCRGFLSPQQQLELLPAILNEGWFTESSHNQAMRFGDLPAWATELSDSICEVVLSSNLVLDPPNFEQYSRYEEACLFPSDLLWREPLFDQIITNVYQPGEGICAHVDLMRFEDGIAIISLESPCVMHFTPVDQIATDPAGEGEAYGSTRKFPVFLAPGSLVLLSGEARYRWKHEINRKPGFQVWEGKELIQERRISITLRKLCQVN